MENEIIEAITNEDGTIKSKEEFMENMSGFYDEVEDAVAKSNGGEFMSKFLTPIAAIPPEEILTRHQFMSRCIYLNSEIVNGIAHKEEGELFSVPEVNTGAYILERIQLWNAEDECNGTPINERTPIQIFIDTPGGDVVTTLQIIDAIKLSKTPVHTIVTGKAFSGGFFIAIAGDKRYALPNAVFLFHEGCGGSYGDAHKAMQGMEFYQMLLKKLKKIVLSNTEISKSVYKMHEKDDWFFDTNEALKLGVIDEITTDINGGIFNHE